MHNLIAKRLDLDLSRKDNDQSRAASLSKELIKKQKWIFILDDLWNSFKLDKVGISFQLNGCKPIIITRSERVCYRMNCQHEIKAMPLSDGDAWTLLMEELGHDIPLSLEVELIVVAVARECAGLPLGIITMAGSLRGVEEYWCSQVCDNEWFWTVKYRSVIIRWESASDRLHG